MAKSGAFVLRQEAGRLLFDSRYGKRQKHRVCHCGRSLNGNFATVFRAPDGSRARVAGTVTCGSGWDCPVCAWKVGEVRGAEVRSAQERWKKVGGCMQLLTLTFPHQHGQPLGEMMEKFDDARQRLRNSAVWKSLLATGKGETGAIGTIAALEVTTGVNGWHPHLHLVAFMKRELTLAEVDMLSGAWVRLLLKVGLGTQADVSAMADHALDVRGADDAANYLTKWGRAEFWGLGAEMTARAAKDAKAGHLKPFGLLAQSIEGNDDAARLFREYADAFHGRRLLVWSPGLREWFGLNDDEDDAAAADRLDEVEANQLVGVLDVDQWRVVLSRGAVAELHEFVAGSCVDPDNGQRDLDEFVDWLRERPAVGGGWFWTPMSGRRVH